MLPASAAPAAPRAKSPGPLCAPPSPEAQLSRVARGQALGCPGLGSLLWDEKGPEGADVGLLLRRSHRSSKLLLLLSKKK